VEQEYKNLLRQQFVSNSGDSLKERSIVDKLLKMTNAVAGLRIERSRFHSISRGLATIGETVDGKDNYLKRHFLDHTGLKLMSRPLVSSHHISAMQQEENSQKVVQLACDATFMCGTSCTQKMSIQSGAAGDDILFLGRSSACSKASSSYTENKK
jgi:hypothetical protein